MKKGSKIEKLAVSAMMLALAFVLSYIKIFQMPFGGSVTLLSMLPICFVSIKYGLPWGFGTAFCYSILQILQGGVFGWGLTAETLVGCLFLDYILAFTSIGIAGLFRKKGRGGMIAGTVLACAMRFVFSFISGFVLWANMERFVAFGAEWVGRPVLYSLCYNGAYMLPETAFTVVGIVVLTVIPVIKKLIKPE